MTMIRLVLSDIKDGMRQGWWKLAVIVVTFALLCGVLVAHSDAPADRTWGDYLASMLAGAYVPLPDSQSPYQFPAPWMLAILAIAFMTLGYPYENLIGMGKHVMLLSGNRSVWWLSKCMWVAAHVALFFVSAFCVSLVFIVLTGGSLSLSVTGGLSEAMGLSSNAYTVGASVAGFCACAFLALLAICLAQLLLSVVIRPLLSFVCTVSYLFVSAFYNNDWLFGGFLMSLRVDGLSHTGLNLVVGSVLSLIVIICVALMGMIVVSRIDIVEKEGI